MPHRHRIAFVFAVAASAIPVSPQAQERAGVMADLTKTISALEKKVVGLARAIPDSGYAWRPSEGVRSTAEALMHVAGDNYFAAAHLGGVVAAETGITGKAYKEVEAYEARKVTRAEVIAAVEQSFRLLAKAMSQTPEGKLATTTNFFGSRATTVQYAWITTTTHLHEHLGQLIAYARSNKIVPPWSK
jgi:hypothetical protein